MHHCVRVAAACSLSSAARAVARSPARPAASQVARHVSSYQQYTRIADVLAMRPAPADAALKGDDICVSGWVRSVRSQKRISFMHVNDGSSTRHLQVVWPSAGVQPPTTGAAVLVRGQLVASPRTEQPVELHASSIEIVGASDAVAYPVQKKAHTPEFLREIVHLRPRAAHVAAMLRLRSCMKAAVHATFASDGYYEVNTPILTSNDCEGAGELFEVQPATRVGDGAPFFGKRTFLSVSGQLHLEAFACALSRVYTFGPTFRAENSNTPRHLSEFWMLEAEAAPATMSDAMEKAERIVKACINAALADRVNHVDVLLTETAHADAVAAAAGPVPFARMTYSDAVTALTSSGHAFVHPPTWADGLALEHERYLADVIVRGPVFVTDYPAAVKPFYMRRNDDADASRPTVAAFDLLMPRIGELVGGSAREERLPQIVDAMLGRGLLTKEGATAALSTTTVADSDNGTLDWYLDLRRYGSMPHAGWGLGFERLVQFVAGIDNIRDAIPVPRVPLSCRL